jgi:hypothetical protein
MTSPEAEEVRKLEEDVQQARLELQAVQLREEIALSMPHLLRKPKGSRKKNAARDDKRGSGDDTGRGSAGAD